LRLRRANVYPAWQSAPVRHPARRQRPACRYRWGGCGGGDQPSSSSIALHGANAWRP